MTGLGTQASAHVPIYTAGVDWITATASGIVQRRNLLEYGRELVKLEARSGNRRRAVNVQGYLGEAAGAAFAGERHDGVMVRLSGSMADAAWADAAVRSNNVTRLDLQVTVVDEEKLAHLAGRHEVEALNRPPVRGRPPKVRLLREQGAPETLYLGSRQSETFCRCYDKTAESPGEYPPGAWRYEVEYKADTAGALVGKLTDLPMAADVCVSLVHAEFLKRGACPVFEPRGSVPDLRWEKPLTDRDATLKWLRDGVAPTLRRAQREGWLAEAVLALTGGVTLDRSCWWKSVRRF